MEPNGEKLVCIGVVTGAHGIRGHVRIKSFTAEPGDVARYGLVYDADGGSSLRVTALGRSRDLIIACIAGVRDRTAAEALKGRRLFVPRGAFPPLDAEEFYHADLVGLHVELDPQSGPQPACTELPRETLGTVVAVHDFGGGDIIEVETERGMTIMVPFTREAVPEVNVAEGRLVIARLPGLLEDTAADRARENEEDSALAGQELSR